MPRPARQTKLAEQLLQLAQQDPIQASAETRGRPRRQWGDWYAAIDLRLSQDEPAKDVIQWMLKTYKKLHPKWTIPQAKTAEWQRFAHVVYARAKLLAAAPTLDSTPNDKPKPKP